MMKKMLCNCITIKIATIKNSNKSLEDYKILNLNLSIYKKLIICKYFSMVIFLHKFELNVLFNMLENYLFLKMEEPLH